MDILGSKSNKNNPNDQTVKSLIDRVHELNQKLFKTMDTDKTRYSIKNDKNEDIIIDNMKCGKTNGSIDLNKCGYLPSNIEIIRNVEGFDTNSTKFVDVNIITDTKNTVTKKTIPLSEFKKLDCNVFPDNCKRYSKMIDGDCYPCDIIEKKNPKKNNMELANMEDIEIDEDALEKAQMSALGIDGFQNFYDRYQQPLHRFRKIDNSEIHNDKIIIEKAFIFENNEQELIIEKNLTTALYLSGISVLGLYLLFKILEK